MFTEPPSDLARVVRFSLRWTACRRVGHKFYSNSSLLLFLTKKDCLQKNKNKKKKKKKKKQLQNQGGQLYGV